MKRVLLSAFILSSVGLTAGFNAAPAMARSDASVPAEFPPLSYKGRQYVDSRGCVYIRASTGGLVDWIPRVTRTREHICNAKPTFAGGFERNLPVIPDPVPAPSEVSPTAKPQPQTTQIARAPKPVKQRTATGSVPAPVVSSVPQKTASAATTKSQRAPRFTLSSLFGLGGGAAQTPKQVKRPAPAPTIVSTQPVQKPLAPRLRTTVPTVVGSPACGGGTSVSQRYLGNGSGVRCRPQAQSPIFGRANGGRSVVAPTAPLVQIATVPQQPTSRALAPTQARPVVQVSPVVQAKPQAEQPKTAYVQVPGDTQKIVPRHVFEKQQQTALVGEPPEGYRPLWTDDRLNPKRAHQTAEGKAAMDLIWTQTVPRQLIDRRTGRDVTRHFPELQYPNTSLTAQTQRKVVVSSKSEPAATATVKPQVKQTAAKDRTYVQVATFAQPGNAQRTAGKLAAKGLPMRIWKAKRGGKSVQLVLAGPFNNSGQANAALSIVRRSGFGDAYLR